jgi:hypothetical protein
MPPEDQGSSPIDPEEAYRLEEEISKERIIITDLKAEVWKHELRLRELIATAAWLGIAIPPATDYDEDPATWNYPIDWPRGISSPSAMDRLKAFLEKNAMKQEDFAERAGFSKRTLTSLVTTGRASIETWQMVAKVMNISVEDLLKP